MEPKVVPKVPVPQVPVPVPTLPPGGGIMGGFGSLFKPQPLKNVKSQSDDEQTPILRRSSLRKKSEAPKATPIANDNLIVKKLSIEDPLQD